MGNRADNAGSDVEIHRRALSDTIHADTPTGAPDNLLALLDQLGLERKTVRTAVPVYVWHEVPAHLDEDEKKRLATRAIPTLLMAGYVVNIVDDVFDEAAYHSAVREVRAHPATAATPAPCVACGAPAGSQRSPRAV